MKVTQLILAAFILIILCSCSNDSEDDLVAPVDPIGGGGNGNGNGNTTLLTYADDIEPIMQSACIRCHASPPVNGAPNSFVNYNQVQQRASAILSRMNLQNGSPGAMPPSGRLPQASIDAVEQWIADGKLEN